MNACYAEYNSKSDAEKMTYLQNLFSEVYFKDIVERYDIGLPDVLEDMTKDGILHPGLYEFLINKKLVKTVKANYGYLIYK